MWININGQTSLTRPQRVRLSDFTTRTAEAVTDELLAELGWQWVPDVIDQGNENDSSDSV